jgi:hypothetical protein
MNRVLVLSSAAFRVRAQQIARWLCIVALYIAVGASHWRDAVSAARLAAIRGPR